MIHQDKNYLKALAYLYGKESVPLSEYQKHLEEIFGGTWNNIFQEMDRLGFLKLNSKMTPPELGFPPTSYSITPAGITYYESLLEGLENIEREGRQGTSRTNWTKVIGGGTLLLIGLTGYLIYLEYNPPYSKVMDEAGKIRFQKVIDSMANVSNDSARKADSAILSKKAPGEIDPATEKDSIIVNLQKRAKRISGLKMK